MLHRRDVVRIGQPQRSLGLKSLVEYYRTEQWQRLTIGRRKSKKARDFCCLAVRFLQPHHLTYVRLARDLPEDLELVSDPCHYQIHRTYRSMFSQWTPTLYESRASGSAGRR